MEKMHAPGLAITALLLALCGSIVPQTSADPSSVVTAEDKDILSQLGTIFQKEFKAAGYRGVQFAVLYYGSKDVKGSINFAACKAQTSDRVFIEVPDLSFNPTKCSFIAGKQKDGKDRHTEKIILWSFRKALTSNVKNYDLSRCPKVDGDPAKSNAYLFTYHSPCLKCDETIKEFADACGEGHFLRLIVGYTNAFTDEAQSVEMIEKTKGVAIAKVPIEGRDEL